MATRRVELGPTGHTARKNLVRIRSKQGLTLRDLSERLAGTDRPLAHNTISEIERGARRMDVDDLVALSAALGVSPIALLAPEIPPDEDADVPVEVTGVVGPRTAQQVWEWLRANFPLDRDIEIGWDATEDLPSTEDFRRANFPLWAFYDDRQRVKDLRESRPEFLQERVDKMMAAMLRQIAAEAGKIQDGDD